METDKLVHLDPATILVGDNIRYDLGDLESLKADILAKGGVLQPIEVEPLTKEEQQNGYVHRLISGARRHAAVLELNKEQNAGIVIPAIPRKLGTDIERLSHQLSENVERRNLSPIDIGIAIKRMLAAGLTRLQVREALREPGKKGKGYQPASNAKINMYLSFLDLPKSTQSLIHSGIVGVGAAYELTKLPADKREAIITRAREERERLQAREEREEARYLETANKVEEAEKKVTETELKASNAQAELAEAEKALDAAEDATGKAAKAFKAKGLKGEAKKAAKEALKAAEADEKGALKRVEAAQREVENLTKAKARTAELAAGLKAKLEESRKAKAKAATEEKGKAKVGKADVQRAAKASGETAHVPLTAAQMRDAIKTLTLAGTSPKVQAIGNAIKSCFDGVTTPGQMMRDLQAVVGESKKPAAKKA